MIPVIDEGNNWKIPFYRTVALNLRCLKSRITIPRVAVFGGKHVVLLIYGCRFVPFRLFAAKRRHAKRPKNAMRKNEKTEKCHAKRRNNAMREDEPPREKTKF